MFLIKETQLLSQLLIEKEKILSWYDKLAVINADICSSVSSELFLNVLQVYVFVTVDNQKLVSCGNDGFLKIFDMNSGSEVFAKNSNQQLKLVALFIVIVLSCSARIHFFTFSLL